MKRFLLPILATVIFASLSGCTTQTGGTASTSSTLTDYVQGPQETRSRVVTVTIDPDGKVTSIDSDNHATAQPSHLKIRRDSASTTQPSISSTGDIKGRIDGGSAGELGDFTFEGIQKGVGNWALAGLALLCAAGCYFLPPPKNYLGIALCLGIAVLALLVPWILAAIAMGLVILVIGYWAVTHMQELRQMNNQLVGAVKNIIDRNPDRADQIKDAAARAQVDPKIKKVVKAA